MSPFDHSCRPPKGSTYLAIGQDLFSIQEYVTAQYNASLHRGSTEPRQSFVPAAAMVYTDIQSLRGLEYPIDYGSGVEYGEGLVNSLFPNENVGLQIGLWLNGTAGCRDIVTGKLKDQVNALVEYLQETRATKVFLRVGYEFDNPSFGFDDPTLYQQAFAHLHKACHLKTNCASKTLFVWHSWAAPRNFPLHQFYPGDHLVDWIGVSVFQQVYSHGQFQGDFIGGSSLQEMDEVLEFATSRNKPTMIAESTPFGGIDMGSSRMSPSDGLEEDPWNRWFQPTLDLIEKYDIDMWCYINCDWDSQPMWHNVGFGETRLSTNALIMDKWNTVVLQKTGKRTFLMAGSLRDCGTSTMASSNRRISSDGYVQHNLVLGVATCCFAVMVFLVLGSIWRPRLQNHRVLSISQDEQLIYGSITKN